MTKSGAFDVHQELVRVGAEWLAGEKSGDYRCSFVVTEFSDEWSDRRVETPDVFGIMVGNTYFGSTGLIECKRTRSDFQGDKHKSFRRNGYGVGNYRFYLCPSGLIRTEELPARWGLLYLGADGNISVAKEPVRFDTKGCTVDERDILFDLTMTMYEALETRFVDKMIAAGLDTELDERASPVSFRLWMGQDSDSLGDYISDDRAEDDEFKFTD